MYLYLYENDACRIKSGFKKEINVTSAFTFVYCLHSQGAKTIVQLNDLYAYTEFLGNRDPVGCLLSSYYRHNLHITTKTNPADESIPHDRASPANCTSVRLTIRCQDQEKTHR